MTVLTAHKILITSAILLFVLYGALELRNYVNGDPSALLRSMMSDAVTVALAVYLRWVWIRKPGDSRRP